MLGRRPSIPGVEPAGDLLPWSGKTSCARRLHGRCAAVRALDRLVLRPLLRGHITGCVVAAGVMVFDKLVCDRTELGVQVL